MPRRKKHPQVKLLHPYYGRVSVDADIADLIGLLWENRIETRYSCQGGDTEATVDGRGYLYFANAQSFEAFIERIYNHPDPDLIESIEEANSHCLSASDKWSIEVSPQYYEDVYEGMSYIVRFPPDDIALLVCVFSGLYVD